MSDRPAILVTGGAGYIGSHCCRALVAGGYHPVTYDNFSTGHRSFVSGSLVTGDLMGVAPDGASAKNERTSLNRRTLAATRLATITRFDAAIASFTLTPDTHAGPRLARQARDRLAWKRQKK